MTNRHSRWDSMRIDDQVGNNTLLGEWHIFLLICHSNCSFLTMSRGELISNLRNSYRSHLYFSKCSAILVDRENNRINFPILRVLQLGWYIFSLFEYLVIHGYSLHLVISSCRFDEWSLSNYNIISTDGSSWFNNSVFVQLLISAMSPSNASSEIWYLEALILTVLRIMICSEEHRPEYASVDTGLVSNDGILLIVPSVASNGHNCIASSRQIFEMKKIHALGADQWLLSIVEHMS